MTALDPIVELCADLVEKRGKDYVEKWGQDGDGNGMDEQAKAYAGDSLQHAIAIRALTHAELAAVGTKREAECPSTIVIGGIPFTMPTDEAKRLIDAINHEQAPLRNAADAVIWFDWSENDDDAVKAIDKLRDAVAGFPQKECICGNSSTLGVVHRADRPCFLYIDNPMPEMTDAEKKLHALYVAWLTGDPKHLYFVAAKAFQPSYAAPIAPGGKKEALTWEQEQELRRYWSIRDTDECVEEIVRLARAYGVKP